MIRFLAADLDGTLLTTSKTITPYTQRVLVEAQQRGLTIILASGRPLYSILPFAEQLELQKHRGFIISFNGSLVWDCAKGKAINEQVIPLSIIPQLVAAIGEDFHIHGYKGNSIVIQGKPDEKSLYIARANKMPLLETCLCSRQITSSRPSRNRSTNASSRVRLASSGTWSGGFRSSSRHASASAEARVSCLR